MAQTFVFFHAHPDDEAIFTGGTIALLAAAGHRCVVAYATAGELGRGAGPGLAELRRTEAIAACTILGAHPVMLGHHDSGLDDTPHLQPDGAFAAVEIEAASEQLAELLRAEGADALIVYDERGVYGHPDHLHVHRVGLHAAARSGVTTVYESTVDREYLHFVDTHVAAVATESVRSLEASAALGSSTVEITNVVDVRAVLDTKLTAIAEHRSQVDDPRLGTGDAFADVYGYEWFVRHGATTAIDDLTG